jgi:HD-GYP domain-containing protein (c-di-GMP phosphodiesterase class II)
MYDGDDMVKDAIAIDVLIKIVEDGGKITTGIDVYNEQGILLLDKDVVVNIINPLEIIKKNGINSIPFSSDNNSGVWDANGNSVIFDKDGSFETIEPKKLPALNGIEKRVFEIQELKKISTEKYNGAKDSIKKVLGEIKETGGNFDYNEVYSDVRDLVAFLTIEDNPFSYLTKEIFSYDDYLYNHSINVCAIGTAIVNSFNTTFSSFINSHLNTKQELDYSAASKDKKPEDAYKCFQKDEIEHICTGFFLHDIGKVMVKDEILNKPGKITLAEFDEIKRHSYDYGIKILEKNKLNNPFLTNTVQYHHAPLFRGQKIGYPLDRKPNELPTYVKICQLSDIYDAMTSKRCYKEAFNQINVVTDIFRNYAKKDNIMQYILHSFVKSIGIYPAGSIVYLRNGQMGYVLESAGPLIIPFTDTQEKTLSSNSNPLDLSELGSDNVLQIDNRRSIKTPREVYDLLPSYLKPKKN